MALYIGTIMTVNSSIVGVGVSWLTLVTSRMWDKVRLPVTKHPMTKYGIEGSLT